MTKTKNQVSDTLGLFEMLKNRAYKEGFFLGLTIGYVVGIISMGVVVVASWT